MRIRFRFVAVVCGAFLSLAATHAIAACGDGSLDGGEECDDGNVLADDCCSPACAFESTSTACPADGNPCTDDFCDGAGSCGVDNTASCDDGDACTVGDECAGGVCESGSTPLDCDDDNACTRDSCDASLGCQHVSRPLPATSCFVAPKTQLQIKSSTPDKNSIKWKWGKGDAFEQTALGAPDSSTTYTFCLFDTAMSAPSLAAGIEVGPGQTWQSKAPKGWSYVDKEGAVRGVKKLSLGTGAAGKTKAQFQAGGVELTMPTAVTGLQYFNMDPQVVAQLVSSNGLCLTSEFDVETATKNDGLNFAAKTSSAPGRTGALSEPGAFAVGTRIAVFVDSSRPTMANGSYPGAATRSLDTVIWYPAETAGSGTPVASGGPFPVVLIAHGFTSQRFEHAGLGQHLASHGFIAVAPNFPLSSVFSPGGPTDRDLIEQAGDVSFVLESVVALGATPLDAFHGQVNGDARGIVGHSLGGQTVMIDGYDKVRADAEIDAVVAMGQLSCHLLSSYYAAGPPLMMIGGTEDAAVPYSLHASVAYERAPAPKHLVTLQGGTHVGFMDASIGQSPGVLDDQFCNAIPLSRPFAQPEAAGFPASDPDVDYTGCMMCNPLGTDLMTAERQHEVTKAAVLAFLLAELKDDAVAAAYLETGISTENADVSVLSAP